ncbi:MAG: prenyltransferase, partial [Pirellulaceae bacterium]
MTALAAQVLDETSPNASAADFLTPVTLKAVEKGLAFLALRQQDEGSFGSGGYSRNVGVCGLAGMAFLAAGSTPGRGPYGKHIDLAIDFVLSQADDSGFIAVAGSPSHGPMYGHGFATLFLAECYGMTRRGDIRQKLTRAVQLIVDTQNNEGGWRYQP